VTPIAYSTPSSELIVKGSWLTQLNALAWISMPRNLPNITSIARHMSQRADPVHLATE
jgi:hypothetical protein